MIEREWAAWGGLWAIGTSAVLWLAAGLDAWHWLQSGTRTDIGYVDASPTVSWIAVGLALVLPLVFAAVAIGWRRHPVLSRCGLLAGGIALMVAAGAWSRIDDTGPLYVLFSVLGGLLGLTGARLGTEPDQRARPGPGWLAGGVLALAGAVLIWVSLASLAYWDWQWSSSTQTLSFMLGALLGGVLVLAGLLGRVLPHRRRHVGPVIALGLLLLALPFLVFGISWLFVEGELLHRFEESESGWAYGTPAVVAGVGLLAGAVAAARRHWSLTAWSVAAGVLIAVVAIARESTIQHLL